MKHETEDRFALKLPGQEDNAVLGVIERRRQPHAPCAGARQIAMVGCYRPRLCGIATYTSDLCDHLRHEQPGMVIDIYAMRAAASQPDNPDVTRMIEAGDRESYRAAARAINASGAEVVWLQHEFGVFGGPDGEMVLDLVERIAAPLVVTMHTIVPEPSATQRRIMERLVGRASRLVVMSADGRDLLVRLYDADPATVIQIEHGTPDRPYVEISSLRQELGIADRPVLSTFGLIGPGKGLEAAIRALPMIAAQHPDVLYRVVGATHPNLVAVEGERYRHGLQELARELGVADNIAWENRFLDTPELLDQIELCDIYLAPYPNLAQVTSGTLAYAVALGRAVISTPFVHARELLAHDTGVLIPDAGSDAIAAAVLALLADRAELCALRRRAYQRGRQTVWPAIASQSAALLVEAVATRSAPAPRTRPSLDAVRGMSDGTGILQHAQGVVPDRHHGYCIDDNARALMLENRLPAGLASDVWALRYAAFIQHAWNPDRARFRNFMSFDRKWLEDAGSDDSNGRALWALGDCAARAHSPDLRNWGLGWFERTAFIAAEISSPRAIAFAMLGAAQVLARHPRQHGLARDVLDRGAQFLCARRRAERRAGWLWLEQGLAYDNARLPEALIRAGELLGVQEYTCAGLASLDWLCEQQTAAAGHFRPVGSRGFHLPGESLPFDQQPLEAWATVDACAVAFRATGAMLWRDRAETAYAWYHGANDRGLALADPATGRCRDGLTPQGVNANVGAESVLSFQLAYRTMNSLFWAGGAKQEAGLVDPEMQARPNAPAYN
jgi:glycosyltransferase involved in cell wall biosynthesis